MGRRAGAGAVGPSLVPVGVSYVESTFQKTGRQGRGARRSRRASNSATMPSYVCLSFDKYLFRCVDVRSFNECFGLCYGVELRLPRSNPPRSTPPPVSPSPSPQPSPLSPPTPPPPSLSPLRLPSPQKIECAALFDHQEKKTSFWDFSYSSKHPKQNQGPTIGSRGLPCIK